VDLSGKQVEILRARSQRHYLQAVGVSAYYIERLASD
jgi:hypothetical protein